MRIAVALTSSVVAMAVWAQTAPPQLSKQKSTPSPAARHSPLASTGSNRADRSAWYTPILRAMNPRNIDWGAAWEARRARFRQNMLTNRYFWLCAALTLLSAALVFVVHAARADRRCAIDEGERQIRMLVAEADSARRQAEEAIERHNRHIERCNLVNESLDKRDQTAPLDASEYARLKPEAERLAAENARLTAELNQANELNRSFSARIEALEQRGLTPPPSAGLVERINRLEEELRRTRDENRRLQVQARRPAAPSV